MHGATIKITFSCVIDCSFPAYQFCGLRFCCNTNMLRPLCLSTKSSRKLIGRMKVDIHVLLPSAIKGEEKSFSYVQCKVSPISIGLKPAWSLNWTNTNLSTLCQVSRGLLSRRMAVCLETILFILKI